MRILGFSGGPNAVHERGFEVFPGAMHDSAAVLLRDGEVVAAIEQERLDRLKHSNKGPFDAIRFCLQAAGLGVEGVDRWVFYGEQSCWDRMLRTYYLEHFDMPRLLDARTLLRAVLARELGAEIPAGQPVFVGHHQAHAMSAVAMSGFPESLVLTLDGEGDEIAGTVATARGTRLDLLETISRDRSLGYFYLRVIAFLGFRIFDEYKVMGLAPYGDPGRYQKVFKSLFTLEAEGRYSVAAAPAPALFEIAPPRRPGEPITQVHMDVAAALQGALEEIVFHLLRHYRQATGQRRLCLAGGVAHNCTLNGKILRSGLFEEVFVQPASHDAGCALGAALAVHAEESGFGPGRRLSHVYWGSDPGEAGEVESELLLWERFLDVERVPDVCAAAADLLAQGQVLGWVQGRSEFGPRALGNRSIVADPRPAGNKDLINAMVKKREAFRPFAPSVLEERAHELFDLPPGVSQLPFMVFTVSVREEQREILGAVTHVDGSARIQTVSRRTNERYWRLIDEFGRRTGVPVLLNTSFNNNAEPIVDSVRDAVVCFLTTQLNALVAGDFVIHKREVSWVDYLKLVPALPRHVEVQETRSYSPEAGWTSHCRIASATPGRRGQAVSKRVRDLLARVDGRATLEELLGLEGPFWNEAEKIVEEVLGLWGSRLISLAPPDEAGGTLPLAREEAARVAEA
jgi:carbamoyltransferase